MGVKLNGTLTGYMTLIGGTTLDRKPGHKALGNYHISSMYVAIYCIDEVDICRVSTCNTYMYEH